MKAPRTSLRLRVVPGADHPGIVGPHGDAWKVRVSAPAEDGKANDAVLELLAATLQLSRKDVQLTRGASSRDKLVELEGVTEESVGKRLAAAAEKRP